jgi:glucoamylase
VKSKDKYQKAKGKRLALDLRKNKSSALLIFAFCLLPFALAQAQGFGTSALSESKVWFTLNDGILSQANYPNLRTNNLSALYFVVTDGKTFAVSERDASVTKLFANTNPRALSFQQTSSHKQRKFTITKRYCAYPDYSTVMMDVEFRAPANYKLYVVFDPALANTEETDNAAAFGGQGAFSVYDGDVCAALIADKGFAEMSANVVSANDGLQTLLRKFKLIKPTERADNSNVICIARIKQPKHFLLALGFADTPEKALVETEHCLEADFADTLEMYENGWNQWLERSAITSDPFTAMLQKARTEKP